MPARRGRKRARKRVVDFDHTLVWSKSTARKSVLSNTHGSVDFPRSPSRDAPAAHARDFPDTPHIPGRLGHGHSQPGPWPRRPCSPTPLASLQRWRAGIFSGQRAVEDHVAALPGLVRVIVKPAFRYLLAASSCCDGFESLRRTVFAFPAFRLKRAVPSETLWRSCRRSRRGRRAWRSCRSGSRSSPPAELRTKLTVAPPGLTGAERGQVDRRLLSGRRGRGGRGPRWARCRGAGSFSRWSWRAVPLGAAGVPL